MKTHGYPLAYFTLTLLLLLIHTSPAKANPLCRQIFRSHPSSIVERIFSPQKKRPPRLKELERKFGHPILKLAESHQWEKVEQMLSQEHVDIPLTTKQSRKLPDGKLRSIRHNLLTLILYDIGFQGSATLVQTRVARKLILTGQFDPSYSPFVKGPYPGLTSFYEGMTVLQMAARFLEFKDFKALANQQPALIKSRRARDGNLLFDAIHGDIKTFIWLVLRHNLSAKNYSHGQSILHVATLIGEIRHIGIILRRVGVEFPNAEGKTALTIAAETNQYNKVTYLVETHFANINHELPNGFRILDLIANNIIARGKKEDLTYIDHLITGGEIPWPQIKMTPARQSMLIFDYFLHRGATAQIVGPDGLTPMQRLVRFANQLRNE
ncbi:MAG: ankyrin repeat domain-containing protein [Bdellovibrionales bacterium]|nr:ankyrin repeat domain-containing protein [Bdellovibrionales bacterium]